MNIAHYLKIFPPTGKPINRGLSKAVDGLAAGLVECGAKVSVLCEGQQESSIQTERGYEIKCFANSASKSNKFSIADGLKKFIQQPDSKLDLVVLNGIFHPSVYLLSRVLKKNNIPYIAAPHDPYNSFIFSSNPHLKWPYWYLLERRMLQQANAIQILDIRHGELLRGLGIKTPVIAVPNGFEPDEVLPESRLEWRENGEPKLLFLGRIDSHNKGLDILVSSFAEVLKTQNAKLVLQGPDFGDRKMLEEKAAKLGLSDRVSIFDPDFEISPTEILAECDIFCLPSRFEGFGLSALEAMLAGRVVLVSEIAGIAPHVKASGCGVVIEPEISSVKRGLLELLERRSQWKEMGLAGRKYVQENLDWKQIAAVVLEQYSSILKP